MTTEWVAAGLYDPAAANADARRALLEFLQERGLSVADMAEADRADRLPLAAGDREIAGGTRRMSLDDMATALGVTKERVRRLWSAAGLVCDDRAFTDHDVEGLRVLLAADEFLGAGAASELVRVAGAALAQVAEAEVMLYARRVAGPLVRDGQRELDMARSRLESAELIEQAVSALDSLHRHHVLAAIDRLGLNATSLAAGVDVVTMTVGFADLSGFTTFAATSGTAAIEAAIRRFSEIVHDVAARHRTRVVKLIGDEVMLASPDPVAACDTAAELCAELRSESKLPALRAAVATGGVVVRDGDYFGPVVNLAARMVDAATSGELLVDTATAQHLGGRVAPRGAQRFKGVPGEVDVWAVVEPSAASS